MLLGESTRRWWILMAMGGVLGLTVLDETVVGVALPTIRADLAVSLPPIRFCLPCRILM